MRYREKEDSGMKETRGISRGGEAHKCADFDHK
jgi:hypothetical protein